MTDPFLRVWYKRGTSCFHVTPKCIHFRRKGPRGRPTRLAAMLASGRRPCRDCSWKVFA